MNRLIYKIEQSKFIKWNKKIRKTNKYKVIAIAIIFLIFVSIFIGLLCSYPYSSNTNIFNDPYKVIDKNLLPLLVGFLSGFSLSVAGCAMQGVLRNSLAGPTTLGFIPIATLGIFVVEVANLTKYTYLFYLFAFLFSLIALFVNFISIKYDKDSYKLVLVGLIFGAFISSLTAILQSYFSLSFGNVNIWIGQTQINYFLGSFKYERLIYSSIITFIGFVLVITHSKKLNIIESNLTLAMSLGINVRKVYWIMGLASILLTISAVNLIGSLVIIGIVMPHLARLILGTRNYYIVTPVSGFLTGTTIMIAMYINAIYNFGLNLYAVIVALPIFVYMMFVRKK